MQTVSTETLRPLDVPLQSASAPLPQVLANEDALVVLYVVEGSELGFDGSNPESISVDSESEHIAVLKAKTVLGLQFGAPNDEALSGHRLYPIGLTHYSAFEVLNSSWLLQLEAMNRVHPRHQPELFAGLRHFIFTFHDSTLEIATWDISVRLVRGSLRTLVVKVAQGEDLSIEDEPLPPESKPAVAESKQHSPALRGGFFRRLLGR